MQVLACAPSNIAVDNLVERLAKAKTKVNYHDYEDIVYRSGFVKLMHSQLTHCYHIMT